MKTRRKRKKRKIGTNFAILLIAAASTLFAGQKDKNQPPAYGIVAGSVFQPSGRSFPQAQVTLIPEPQPDSAPVKMKKFEATSNSRGEFVFHVPPVRMHYVLRVSAKGFQSQEKPVDISGEERQDVTFQMEPESK